MKRFALLLGALLLLAGSVAVAGDNGETYEVTVTNLTRGQILSPPLVVSHDASVSLFEPGQPASPELASLAEDAVDGPLVALLLAEPGVGDVQVGSGGILPGGSRSVTVRVRGNKRLISFASMLVTTNDSFAAARALRAHPGRSTLSVVVPAYDAGSEENNESCAFIPGPPCMNPGVRATENAEGYVYINPGVQGIGDLTGVEDWRNPVASVSVRRVKQNAR